MSNDSANNSHLYGKGVFTTVAIRDGEPLLWEKHWRRLVRDAEVVGVDISKHTEESTRRALDEVTMSDGRARITFHDDSPSRLWTESGEIQTTLSIVIAPPREVRKPFRLTVSPFALNSRSPLAGVKSCNYLENILAKNEAEKRGFYEAVRVNEYAHIVSGCMSNIFWSSQDKLFTPSLSTGCLAGTTREYILENLDCEEGEFEISDVKSADAIFLTSAGMGIVSVAEIDGNRAQKYTKHHELFRDLSCNFSG